jgi:hypothetical protein
MIQTTIPSPFGRGLQIQPNDKADLLAVRAG